MAPKDEKAMTDQTEISDQKETPADVAETAKDRDHIRPWEQVSKMLQAGDPERLQEFWNNLSSGQLVRTLFRLSDDEQSQLLRSLPPEMAADIIEEVPDVHAANMLEDIAPQDAASIVGELNSQDAADLLRELEDDDLEDILAHMDDEDAADARQLISYDEDSAGGLMMTEYQAFNGAARVGDVIASLAATDNEMPLYALQQVYITRPSGLLRGCVNLSDIAFVEPERQLGKLVQPVETVRVDEDISELQDFFEEHDQVVVPVVDFRNRLVGVLRRRVLYDELAEREQEDNLKRQGIVGGEELRSLPVYVRSGRRLSWLSVNIFLNMIAASVIALYQDTLQAVIALAVFLPIVSDMSGCSGNQAVAVSMRELTLGIVKPADVMRVWMQEVSVGLINGLALGCMIALAAWLWKGNLWLGGVIGLALALNTVLAVSLGGSLPLILKGLKVDPALASGPVLTTVTDMCGFFLVLSLASLAMSHIAV
jgi:magnesium transporter